MAIGTPTKIGSNTAASGTTVVITTSGTASIGDLVIVAVYHDGNTSTVTVTDSRSNTWQNDAYNSALGTGNLTAIRSSVLTTAIQVSDTITATFGSSTTNSAIVAYKVTGMASASWLDQTLATADQGATSTPSSGNVTTTQAAELLFGAVGHDTSATTTAGSGYTLLDELAPGAARKVATEYQIVAATSTYAATFTESGTCACRTVIATYKGAVAATTNPNLLLLGVG